MQSLACGRHHHRRMDPLAAESPDRDLLKMKVDIHCEPVDIVLLLDLLGIPSVESLHSSCSSRLNPATSRAIKQFVYYHHSKITIDMQCGIPHGYMCNCYILHTSCIHQLHTY